jgi:hypothetical protein
MEVTDRKETLPDEAVAALRSIAASDRAPAAARATAARSLAEIAGLIGRAKAIPSTDQRLTAELTLEEIDREIEATRALLELELSLPLPGPPPL